MRPTLPSRSKLNLSEGLNDVVLLRLLFFCCLALTVVYSLVETSLLSHIFAFFFQSNQFLAQLVSNDGSVTQRLFFDRPGDTLDTSMFLLATLPVVRRELERPEDLLAENERFIEQLTNTIPDMLYVFDYQERAVIYQNNQVASILGFSKEEIGEMGDELIEKLVHPSDLRQLPKLLSKYDRLKDGEFFEHEFRAKHKSGEFLWLRSRDVIFKRASDGKVAQVLAIAHDITDRKRDNEALLESQERNASILAALPDLFFVQSEDGTYLDYHVQDSQELLVAPEDFLGKKMRDVLPPEMFEGIERSFNQAKETGKPARSEYSIMLNGGEYFYEYRVVWSGDNRFFTIVRDITEQKTAIEALAESEARFKDHYRGIPIPTYTWRSDDGDFVLIDFNDDAFCSSNGAIEREVGSRFSDRYKDYPEVLECIDNCFHKKITVEKNMFREVSKDGRERIFRMTFVPIPPDMVMLHAEDITKRVKTEKALAESEAKYRRIVDTMLEGIWIVDSEFRVILVNQQLAAMLQYSEDEMIGRYAYEFVFGKTGQDFEQVKKNRISGISEQYDARLRRKDGTNLWVLVSATPIQDDSGEFAGSLAMVTDITERKLAEEALRKSEEHFRLAVEAAEIYSWEIDIESRVFKWAENGNRANRFTLPRTFDEALSNIHPDDVSNVREAYSKAVKDCGEYQMEYRYLTPENKEEVWHLSAGMMFPDGNGKAIRGVGVTQDITDQKKKEEELRLLTARLLNLQDEERRRLARELHDQTAQNLAILNVNLSAIKNLLGQREKAESLLTQSEEINQRALREVRTLSYVLHPPMLDESGLVSALRWFVRGFSDRSLIKIDLVERTSIGRLPTDIEIALYRVVQEGLTNIHRHSGSPTARIELKRDAAKIVLTVKDKGKGLPQGFLNSKASVQSYGVGIPGMRERLHLLGGRLDIRSDNKGTTLKATVPITDR